MNRSLFLAYFLAIFLSCTATQCSAQGNVSLESKMTPDEAVAAVGSKKFNSGSSFLVIRELDSNTARREVAEHSLYEASSHHVSLYSGGIFLDLLNRGGFLILETDGVTGDAISLNLVSSGSDGSAVIESRKIEGKVSANLAQRLIKETAAFVDILFDDPGNVSTIESRFYGGRFPESDEPAEAFFAIPPSIPKTGADQSAIRDLAAQFGASNVWPIRHAISMPIFPASPTGALGLAKQRYEALIKEFIHGSKETPDHINDAQDLKSVRTSEQLRDHVATLRRINNFLEQKLRAQYASPTLSVNKSISSIPLQLGVPGPPEEVSYAVMMASGIIVDWKLLKTGDLVVARVSLAGD